MTEKLSAPVSEAVARTRRKGEGDPATRGPRGGRSMDVFGGEIRRRDVFPLLVLHLIRREPAYGNRLIEGIEGAPEGGTPVTPTPIYRCLPAPGAPGLTGAGGGTPVRAPRASSRIPPPAAREH